MRRNITTKQRTFMCFIPSFLSFAHLLSVLVRNNSPFLCSPQFFSRNFTMCNTDVPRNITTLCLGHILASFLGRIAHTIAAASAVYQWPVRVPSQGFNPRDFVFICLCIGQANAQLHNRNV